MTTASKEVDEIRRQMAEIRLNLHEDVRGVVATAEAAADWRRYLTAYPWVALGAAFAVGYFIVPRRAEASLTVADLSKVREAVEASKDQVIRATRGKDESAEGRKKGLVGAAFGMLVPLALKAAQGYALKYAEQWLLDQQLKHMHAGPAPFTPGAAGGPGVSPNRPGGPRPGVG